MADDEETGAIMNTETHNEIVETMHRARGLVQKIRPILAHQGPETQGAVLVDLVAIWLAGHHPAVRDETLSTFLDTLTKLIVVNEKIMFGDGGFPTEGLH